MSFVRLMILVAASLLASVAATAQEAAVMKKSVAPKGLVVAMRHVGARTQPAQPVVIASAASAKTTAVRSVRALPVHFRH